MERHPNRGNYLQSSIGKKFHKDKISKILSSMFKKDPLKTFNYDNFGKKSEMIKK
jgi:hypothetical protein